MTLKDQFDVKGYDSTLGYVGRAFRPALQDCVLVSMLKAMGAVILAKSNLPQSIMVSMYISIYIHPHMPTLCTRIHICTHDMHGFQNKVHN